MLVTFMYAVDSADPETSVTLAVGPPAAGCALAAAVATGVTGWPVEPSGAATPSEGGADAHPQASNSTSFASFASERALLITLTSTLPA
jgi:hypothetical protein